MVMIDRTFNQEERSNLTQDKRMVLVDPGKKNKKNRIRCIAKNECALAPND